MGTFTSNGTSYPFTAIVAGNTLTLTTAGAAYALHRADLPPSAAVITRSLELARTATGRTVTVPVPAAPTADAALDAALPQLAGIVGGDVTVTGRFHDTKRADRGGASFTASINNRAVRGVAFCGKTTAGGVDVLVAYCAADAPAGEWATLTAALPHPTPLRTYDFPDGTGSIGVPDGWQCGAASALDAIVVTGPDGQMVIYNSCVSINGEQSPLVRVMRDTQRLADQNRAMMRQMGGDASVIKDPPPPHDVFFGEFGDPLPLLQHLFPQISANDEYHGRPSREMGRVLASAPADPVLPGARAVLASYLWSTGGPTPERFQSINRLEAAEVAPGASMLTIAGVRAHADTFDRELPTLWAVSQSLKSDAKRVREVGQARIDQTAAAGQARMKAQHDQFERQQQLSFARHQAVMDAQADQFDRVQRAMTNQSLVGHRAAADTTEMIGGYQKIVNTRTGEARHVDYLDSTGIVAGLNEAAGDNAEWVAVHRRDEVYPVTR